MAFDKKILSLNLILILSLCVFQTFASTARASEPQVLTVEEIEKGAEDHLASILPWERKLLEINVDYEGNDITLPPGKKKLIYEVMGSKKQAGRIPLTLLVRVDENYKKRLRINSRVLVSQSVVKTVRRINRGESFTDENIQVETIQTERPWKNALESPEQALGYEASRYLPSGKILTQKVLKKPALGNKGDKILILAEKAGMKITAPGILKEDGYEDGMVEVLNMESKKTVYGRLIDANTVKVSF
jgi:flagella basal body P-ring formation protein FlgA